MCVSVYVCMYSVCVYVRMYVQCMYVQCMCVQCMCVCVYSVCMYSVCHAATHSYSASHRCFVLFAGLLGWLFVCDHLFITFGAVDTSFPCSWPGSTSMLLALKHRNTIRRYGLKVQHNNSALAL
jgi:hypothetical protein